MDDPNLWLKKLDEVLASCSESEISYQGLKLMEKVSETDEGLKLLYSTYKSRQSLTFKNAMSFILARKARTEPVVVSDLLFAFVDSLDGQLAPQTLLNTLSAIETVLISGSYSEENLRNSGNLFEIIQKAINYSGEMEPIIQDAAISLLFTFCEINEISIFKELQIEWFFERISFLIDKENSSEDREKLLHCLKEIRV